MKDFTSASLRINMELSSAKDHAWLSPVSMELRQEVCVLCSTEHDEDGLKVITFNPLFLIIF